MRGDWYTFLQVEGVFVSGRRGRRKNAIVSWHLRRIVDCLIPGYDCAFMRVELKLGVIVLVATQSAIVSLRLLLGLILLGRRLQD